MGNWLRPPHIYEFPTVEYIPIPVRTVAAELRPELAAWGPSLSVLPDVDAYRSLSSNPGLTLPADRPPDFGANLVLAAFNAEVRECNYRAYKATLVGRSYPGLCQVFQLTRRYFYKDSLQFCLYDQRGTMLASARTDLDSRRGDRRGRLTAGG